MKKISAKAKLRIVAVITAVLFVFSFAATWGVHIVACYFDPATSNFAALGVLATGGKIITSLFGLGSLAGGVFSTCPFLDEDA